MAFSKPYSDERAVDYSDSYWHITQILVDVKHKHADFCFSGFKNEAASKSGASEIGSISVTVANAEFKEAFADEEKGKASWRALGYKNAKIKDFFKDALDV